MYKNVLKFVWQQSKIFIEFELYKIKIFSEVDTGK